MSIKISELPQATSVGSSDIVPIVQGGTTKQATAGMINSPSFAMFSASASSITITTSWNAGSKLISATSRTLTYGDDFIIENGKIKINSNISYVQISSNGALGNSSSSSGTLYLLLCRERNGTLEYLYANGVKVTDGGWAFFPVLVDCQQGDLFSFRLGKDDDAGSSVTITASASRYMIIEKKATGNSSTRSLNLTRATNTGSLVGLGDKAEVTDETLEKTKLDEVTEVKEAEAKTEEIEKEGSGDER